MTVAVTGSLISICCLLSVMCHSLCIICGLLCRICLPLCFICYPIVSICRPLSFTCRPLCVTGDSLFPVFSFCALSAVSPHANLFVVFCHRRVFVHCFSSVAFAGCILQRYMCNLLCFRISSDIFCNFAHQKPKGYLIQ